MLCDDSEVDVELERSRIFTHFVHAHELSACCEDRAVRIYAATLVQQVVDCFMRIQDQDFVTKGAEAHQMA